MHSRAVDILGQDGTTLFADAALFVGLTLPFGIT